MKFANLVKFRNEILSTISTTEIINSIKTQFNLTKSLDTETLDPSLKNYLTNINESLQKLLDSTLSDSNTTIINVIDKINKEISSQSNRFFDATYKVRYNYDDVSWIKEFRTCRLPLSIEVKDSILRRLRAKVDWHYPCLEIGSNGGVWTEFLVGGDPLYLLNSHKEFSDATMNQFNADYQRRLRPYIYDINLGWDYSYLPQNQFGFIFSWNQFNYIPFVELTNHLSAIFNLLRDGGSFLFTFNDGDTYQGADNADILFMSYVPKSKLIEHAKEIGFIIGEFEDYNNTVSWIELIKPGVLKTCKAHQVLGVVSDR